MKLNDYIQGARHGEEAHDLELEAMRDPLLGDALDGFDAVPGAPGEHSATLDRLAERIGRSATEGRAAARSRASTLRERRVRSWSIAAAAVFLAGIVGGGAWLLRDGIRPGESTLARHDGGAYFPEIVDEILPPVTVIEEESAQTAPTASPPDISDMRLDDFGVRERSATAGEIVAPPVPAPVTEPASIPAPAQARAPIQAEVAETEADVQLEAVIVAPMGRAEAQMKTVAPVADTTQTDRFRRYLHDALIVRSWSPGRVTLSFEVGTDGRPQNITVTETPSSEAAAAATDLLQRGPDWPADVRLKSISFDL